VRSIAVDILPNTWQIILGSALLLTILFLPDGLGSLFGRLAQTGKSTKKSVGEAAEKAGK